MDALRSCSRDFSTPDWTKAKLLKLLKLFSSEPILWDSSHKYNKVKKHVNEAWKRISVKLDNIPIAELKKRKKNLLTRYRGLAKKKKIDMEAGYDEEICQPSWYAFELMDSFLGSSSSSHEDPLKIESERQIETKKLTFEADDKPEEEIEVLENSYLLDLRNENSDNESIQSTETIRSHKAEISNCSSNNNFKSKKVYEDDDECELYARLLAKKLKRYPVQTRHRLMYTIDGILLDNPYPKDRIK